MLAQETENKGRRKGKSIRREDNLPPGSTEVPVQQQPEESKETASLRQQAPEVSAAAPGAQLQPDSLGAGAPPIPGRPSPWLPLCAASWSPSLPLPD